MGFIIIPNAVSFISIRHLYTLPGRWGLVAVAILVVFGAGLCWYVYQGTKLSFHPDWTETDQRQMQEIVNFLSSKQKEEEDKGREELKEWMDESFSFGDFETWAGLYSKLYVYGKQCWIKNEYAWFREVVFQTARTGNVSYIGRDDWTLLNLACALGKRELACHLMDKGADVNLQSLTEGASSKVPGDAPINWLAGGGLDFEHPMDTETILYLMEKLASHGANLNIKAMGAITPFEMLCMSSSRSPEDKEKLILKLMDMGADLSSPVGTQGDRRSPLCFPMRYGLYRVVQRMCERGVDVNEGYEGKPPLFLVNATKYPERQLKIVRTLLAHGARINAPNPKEKGKSPLASLCCTLASLPLSDNKNNAHIPALFSLYLEKGADVNQTAENGKTPLMYLFDSIDIHKDSELAVELSRLFLKYGAESSLKDDRGKTVADIIKKRGKAGEAILDKLPELLPNKKK